ncbi:RHS repeat domain-containing protein [Lysobacter sp. CA199]|uniref:RHS repeat domain-containing protein n=1 Tax=Lysobacter sp. CA199 TaxID=3455608 RepID=UPI003F8D54AA
MKWISKLAVTAALTAASFLTQAQTVVEYIHTDALGSPVAVTDANQNVIERTEYEPYGAQINRPVQDGPGYTGHVSDAATELSYMQQRYYDSTLGRFLSVDPVTTDSSAGANFNRYRYANNNTYKFTDPDGRQAVERFVEQHRADMEAGNGAVYEPLQPIAIAVTAIMAAPVVVVAVKEAGMAVLAHPGKVAVATEAAAGAAGVTGTGAASTLKPGPFAGASIPARSAAQTFNNAERAAINKIGQATGCHTCGTTTAGTKSGNFVPDHQPVSKLNTDNAPQKLFPQCIDCSRRQGGEVLQEKLRQK